MRLLSVLILLAVVALASWCEPPMTADPIIALNTDADFRGRFHQGDGRILVPGRSSETIAPAGGDERVPGRVFSAADRHQKRDHGRTVPHNQTGGHPDVPSGVGSLAAAWNSPGTPPISALGICGDPL